MNSKGRDQLLSELMKAHGDELVRLAFTYVKSEETAKDMVQNTFMKCYQHLDSFRGESAYRTWLFRITINECKDYLKSWHYKKTVAAEKVKEISTFASAEKAAIRHEQQREVNIALLALPTGYREVLDLYYFRDFKIEEIAELIGEKQNTVKTRLKRGREKLKVMLEEAERIERA
ncbi:sigma-70 family RNA polymerase sigma factor [Jeotgalibacillus haloalkalitolerans]|uniref:Sigma-70 family RNA polymerase sigma factor n=1 Tax=Jeotgalibacillus haloalkalitolerans TaxID=3104292 RepID=A0ABU5KJW6_9BACL|nr:sigma-70 family RNA polymerase sigma factor [Jeotgalibacillus sp. HH7-29]MDZ5711046.1 sigma-70 family RNA polymerase sigma factor [Jeotgalibacillus sp. HH7-29]